MSRGYGIVFIVYLYVNFFCSCLGVLYAFLYQVFLSKINNLHAVIRQSQVESYQRLKKMVFDAALLSNQYYKIIIKGKVEHSRGWGCAIPYSSV